MVKTDDEPADDAFSRESEQNKIRSCREAEDKGSERGNIGGDTESGDSGFSPQVEGKKPKYPGGEF